MWVQSKYTIQQIASFTPGRYGCNIKVVILKGISGIDILSISGEISLRSRPWDMPDDQSTFVQAMAWCCQATSHYLCQSWPRSLSPYGVIGPLWVNILQNAQYGYPIDCPQWQDMGVHFLDSESGIYLQQYLHCRIPSFVILVMQQDK